MARHPVRLIDSCSGIADLVSRLCVISVLPFFLVELAVTGDFFFPVPFRCPRRSTPGGRALCARTGCSGAISAGIFHWFPSFSLALRRPRGNGPACLLFSRTAVSPLVLHRAEITCSFRTDDHLRAVAQASRRAGSTRMSFAAADEFGLLSRIHHMLHELREKSAPATFGVHAAATAEQILARSQSSGSKTHKLMFGIFARSRSGRPISPAHRSHAERSCASWLGSSKRCTMESNNYFLRRFHALFVMARILPIRLTSAATGRDLLSALEDSIVSDSRRTRGDGDWDRHIPRCIVGASAGRTADSPPSERGELASRSSLTKRSIARLLLTGRLRSTCSTNRWNNCLAGRLGVDKPCEFTPPGLRQTGDRLKTTHADFSREPSFSIRTGFVHAQTFTSRTPRNATSR